MSKLTDLLKLQRDLKAEAGDIVKAAKDAKAEMTDEQKTRFAAIEQSLKDMDAKFDELAALPDIEAVRIEAAAATETAKKEAAEAAAKEARELAANVAGACAIAGQPAKAAAFIKDAKPLAEVVVALQAGKVDGSGRELSNHGGGNADGPTWDKAIARQNARLPS